MNLIEQVTEYWDRQPCNVKHSNAKFGTKQWSDEITERKYFVEQHIPRFAEFEKWRGKNILEVGCGIGTDAISFMKAGANYSGIDISSKSVSIANKRLELEGGFINHCSIQNAEESLDFTHNKFNLVYSFGVLHHTPSPKQAIKNIRQVIKKDGEFRLMLYARNSWKHIMVTAGLDHYENQNGCPIVHTYTYESLCDLLEPEFYVLSIEQTHIFPYIIKDYRNYKYNCQPYFEAMSPAMFNALEKNLGQHLLIIAKPR